MKKFHRQPRDPFVSRIIMSFVTGEFYCKICKKHYQSRSGIMGHITKIHDKEIEEKVAAEFPLKKSTEFLGSLEKAETDDEYFSDKHADQAKSLIRNLLGDDSLCRDEEEKRVYNLFCENCGCRFQSENPSKRFHSPSCASLFINRKRMEERDGRTEKEEQ